jgi:hypothetical protein
MSSDPRDSWAMPILVNVLHYSGVFFTFDELGGYNREDGFRVTEWTGKDHMEGRGRRVRVELLSNTGYAKVNLRVRVGILDPGETIIDSPILYRDHLLKSMRQPGMLGTMFKVKYELDKRLADR